jgi:predicted peptidase
MLTRREALGVIGAISVGRLLAPAGIGPLPLIESPPDANATQDTVPPLAPGAPTSRERMALIDAFRRESAGVDQQFEARTHESDWVMPYRLFRPKAAGPLPLVLFLHGSGGLGTDNVRQMGLGNVFGTRIWALAEHQRNFSCYVLVPQTDRGWARYGAPAPRDSIARAVPGLGDGARVAMELVDRLCDELPIDRRRMYVTGQSMGGAGVWNMTAHRPTFFAAAVACCGSATADDPADSVRTPLWNFHGDADKTVPVAVSRARIAAMRNAGGHPFSTEYAGVNHNVWEWAYTEPELTRWLFRQRR